MASSAFIPAMCRKHHKYDGVSVYFYPAPVCSSNLKHQIHVRTSYVGTRLFDAYTLCTQNKTWHKGDFPSTSLENSTTPSFPSPSIPSLPS